MKKQPDYAAESFSHFMLSCSSKTMFCSFNESLCREVCWTQKFTTLIPYAALISTIKNFAFQYEGSKGRHVHIEVYLLYPSAMKMYKIY